VDELDLLKRQVDRTLKSVARSTAVGVVVLVVLALLISGSRGILLIVAAVYLITSATAYFVLRRNLRARIARHERAALEAE
jgi:hypothetical protein